MTTTDNREKNKAHTTYYDSRGNKLPGVTTVLNVTGFKTQGLMYWAWDMGMKGIDFRKARDSAADVGTLAHAMIMSHLRKEELDLSEYSPKDVDQAQNCLIKYWDWEKQYNVKPALIEFPLIHDVLGFGGTLDLLAEVNHELWLVDYKTSKGLYTDMLMQVGGYYLLLIENHYEPKQVRILRIGRSEDEGFEEKVLTLKEAEYYADGFIDALRLYKWSKGAKKNGS